MLVATLMLALREVRRNALRSLLTMLGIVIGVGAVIALVTIGQGATAKVQSDISALGENLLMVRAGADRGPGGARGAAEPFEAADVAAIRRELTGIEAVTATASTAATLVFGNENWPSTVTGTDAEYLTVKGYRVAEGRTFSEAEYGTGQGVCLIGNTVKKELFGAEDPVGTRIRVGKVSCLVTGVLAAKGQAAMGMDQDDLVLVPLAAYHSRIAGNDHIDSIELTAAKNQSIEVVQGQLESLLRERRRVQAGEEDDFAVRNVQEIAATMSQVTTSLTGLLGGIAAVSLLVGGIGIMNIMLVSVTERTREVGTRLAIGALANEVLLQFLVEAIVVSMLGGLVGIGAGLGMSYATCTLLGLPFTVSPWVAMGAFVFSALVGIGFGYLPARKAARLNPIEALRHE